MVIIKMEVHDYSFKIPRFVQQIFLCNIVYNMTTFKVPILNKQKKCITYMHLKRPMLNARNMLIHYIKYTEILQFLLKKLILSKMSLFWTVGQCTWLSA
jgi:hypothetical protein